MCFFLMTFRALVNRRRSWHNWRRALSYAATRSIGGFELVTIPDSLLIYKHFSVNMFRVLASETLPEWALPGVIYSTIGLWAYTGRT